MFLALALSTLASLALAETTEPNTGPQPQGFLFGFSQTSLILPITYSCPTPLYLSAATSLNYPGPDAQGPYSVVFMVHEQLIDEDDNQYDRWYSHTEVVQDMNNPRFLTNPWMNGTQFIACVWSQNGVSGGCQDLFTVVPSEDQTASAYANSSSTCRAPGVREAWATPRNQTLDVELLSTSGTMSPNGWPPSCSDLQFRPKNGTGPYTTIIAPAQHPPINISSADSADNYMNYTVRLTHGQAFMASVYDSAGNSWTVGPLHAGNSNQLACLATATGQAPPPVGGISAGALGGGIAGAFLAGGLIAGGIFFFLDKKRKHRERLAARRETLDLYAEPRPANFDGSGSSEPKPHHGMITPFSENPPHLGYAQSPSPPAINTNLSLRGEGSQISPSSLRSNEQQQQYTGGLGMARSGTVLSGHSLGHSHSPHRVNSPPLNERTTSSFGADTASQLGEALQQQHQRPTSAASADAAALSSRNLYVVHSDGGNDYHIQLPGGHNGMNVIELPPGYSPGSGGGGGGGASSSSPQQAEPAAGGVHLGPSGRPETEKERLRRMAREQGGSPAPQ